MARDVKKEYQWERTFYKRFQFKIKKEFGEQFSDKLKENGTNLSEWVRQHIINYMGEEK